MTGTNKSKSEWLKSVLPEGIFCCEVTVPLHANPEIKVTYTDCHEVSLLRLLQMFLADLNKPSTIDIELAKEKIQPGLRTNPSVEVYLNNVFNYFSRPELEATYRLEHTKPLVLPITTRCFSCTSMASLASYGPSIRDSKTAFESLVTHRSFKTPERVTR